MRRKVFVVVLNWNRPDDTLGCLDSLSKLILDDIDLTVVVVDNASSDDSVERIKNLRDLLNFVFWKIQKILVLQKGIILGLIILLERELIM